MTAIQTNADTFNPNALHLVRVATYERRIRASLTRVWENVLDWEHLPHLHATSFDYIELEEAGQWGWRTWSDPGHRSHIELTVASANSYVARSYQEGKQVSEIWTELSPVDNLVDVKVSFYIPDVIPEDKDKLGQLMVSLYTRLWDEDEQMMQERERRLTEQRDTSTEKNLGPVKAIKGRLAAGEPVVFELGRRTFRMVESDGSLVAHQDICPHLLGPLSVFEPETGTVSCPWHGYRFDLETGKCVSPAGATCRLGIAPEVTEDGENLVVRLGQPPG